MLQAIPSPRPLWHLDFRQSQRAFSKRSVAIATSAPGQGKPVQSGVDPAVLSRLLTVVGDDRDRDAFAELFRHFAPRLKSYLLRLGGDAAAAEESMQEAMVLVWRKAGQFDPAKASASTWIFTIARNVRIDSFRRERRPEFDPEDPALVPDPVDPPDVQLTRDQSAVRVREAMSNLSEAEQTVLRLSFFEDLSHSAIAERLALPLGTVKSRLRLAFGKLRDKLSDVGGTE